MGQLTRRCTRTRLAGHQIARAPSFPRTTAALRRREPSFSRQTTLDSCTSENDGRSPWRVANIGNVRGKPVPLHHTPSAGQRMRTNQRRWPSRTEAEDPLARRHHPPGDVAPGVHAAAGCARAQAEAAPDSVSWGAGTQRQAARAGGAARG